MWPYVGCCCFDVAGALVPSDFLSGGCLVFTVLSSGSCCTHVSSQNIVRPASVGLVVRQAANAVSVIWLLFGYPSD